MPKSKLTIVEILALTVAAVFTGYLLLRSADWKIDGGTIAFLAWAVSPFVVFHFAGRLFKRFIKAPHLPMITALIAVLMLAFTLLVYIPAALDQHPMEGFVYLVVPMYLYIGSLFLLALGTAIAWFTRRRVRSESEPPALAGGSQHTLE